MMFWKMLGTEQWPYPLTCIGLCRYNRSLGTDIKCDIYSSAGFHVTAQDSWLLKLGTICAFVVLSGAQKCHVTFIVYVSKDGRFYVACASNCHWDVLDYFNISQHILFYILCRKQDLWRTKSRSVLGVSWFQQKVKVHWGQCVQIRFC